MNLLADMGAQPASLQIGADPARPLVAASRVDATLRADVASSPRRRPAARSSSGERVTITGTASDSGGGVVAGVEVSIDGGATWHAAQGTTAWSYRLVARRARSGRRFAAARSTTAATWKPPARASPCPLSPAAARARTCGNRPRFRPWRDTADPSAARTGRQVPERRRRPHQRRALLQERGQHRHARRQPVDEHRHAARHGDVRRRDRLRLAGSARSTTPVAVAANTTYVVVVSHQRRPLLGDRRLLQQRRRRLAAAACAADRHRRRQRRLPLRRRPRSRPRRSTRPTTGSTSCSTARRTPTRR